MSRPNIVVFFSDQQRFDTLGINGQQLPVTPNLDAFASEGVNFTNCFTCQPVCGPARSCLQTGLYPTQTGCFTNKISLPLGSDTVARRLKNAGYSTGYVGKWHLASDQTANDYRTSAVPPERRGGYDDYWMSADMLELTSHGYGGYVFDSYGNRVEFSGYRCDCITDYALNYIDSYTGDEPFFLFVSHIEPHHQNDRETYEGPEGSKERWSGFVPPPDLEKGKGDWEEFYPDYLGCCNALDINFGRVIEALKRKGIYDNTLLIYTSDHGNHFRTRLDERDPNGGTDDYKRNSFENTIHIPLLIRGPGFQKGHTDSRMVSLMDIPITLLTAAGCGMPENIQGAALQQSAENWRDDVYLQISESFVGRAVRTDRYKYTVYAPGLHPWKDMLSKVYEDKYLFDIINDPLEKHNLIDDPSCADIKEDMRQRLKLYAQKAGEGDIEIISKGAASASLVE